MPEPCPFLSRKLPPCSIISPTETKGIAKGVVKFLTDMGLFIGQSSAFFAFLNDLAEDADEASEADKKGTSTPAAVRFLSAAAFNCWKHTISLESPAEAYRVQSNNRN